MRATLDGFANPKATDAARRERAAEHLRSIDRRPARTAALDAALKRLGDMIAAGPAKAGELEDVRGLQFRSRIGCDGQHYSFAIGTFPYELFASGHTFFSQSLQLRRGFSPVAVHTTFQFCDTAEFAWGKRSRLRERLLWLVDPDSYYERVGPASEPQPEPTELEYSGFLHLDGALPDPPTCEMPLADSPRTCCAGALLDMSSWPRPYMRSEASAAIKVEGSRSFIDETLARKSDVHTMRDGPARHLLLDSFQRRLIHDALALARAMKRKLILPPLQCWSDRYWNALVRGRFPGVRADAQPLPFHCPFDHLFDNEKWAHSDAPIREHSFLDSHRVLDRDRNDSVRLVVRGAPAEARDHLGREPAVAARTLELSPGDDYAKAASALQQKGWGGAYVVKVGARSLELLCESLGSAKANAAFNKVVQRVLGIGEQIRYCDDADNRRWPGDARHPINCARRPAPACRRRARELGRTAQAHLGAPAAGTWGFHRPPPLPEGSGGLLGVGASAPAACRTDAKEILAARFAEPERSWKGRGGESWSTQDRPGYLYHQYMNK